MNVYRIRIPYRTYRYHEVVANSRREAVARCRHQISQFSLDPTDGVYDFDSIDLDKDVLEKGEKK